MSNAFMQPAFSSFSNKEIICLSLIFSQDMHNSDSRIVVLDHFRPVYPFGEKQFVQDPLEVMSWLEQEFPSL